MNFKYFLRGLGVGIVFSAIICLTVYNGNATTHVSDDEIIKRAKQLGYVKENDVVEQKMDQLKNETVANEDATDNKKQENNSSDSTKEVSSESASAESTTKESTEKSEEKSETTSKGTTKETTKETTKAKATEQKKETETTKEVTTQKSSVEEKKTTEVAEEKIESKKDTSKKEEKKDDTVSFTVDPGSSSYPVCLKLKELGLVDNAEEFDTYLVENGYANRISVGEHSLKKGMSYHDIAEAISDPI